VSANNDFSDSNCVDTLFVGWLDKLFKEVAKGLRPPVEISLPGDGKS